MPSIANKGVRTRLKLALNEINELTDLLDITLYGFGAISILENTLKVLHETNRDKSSPEELETHERKLASARKQKAVYEKQSGEDFTKIVEMYTVYLWSKVDNLISDVLQEHISSDVSLSSLEGLSNITVPIKLLELSKEERSYYIISQVSQKLNTPLKQGVGRFEAMLKVFGLGGEVPKEISDLIYELSNVRNIIVHNNSFADDKFVTKCPQLNYKVGERIKVDVPKFFDYLNAVQAYVVIVLYRFRREEIPDDFSVLWKKHDNTPEA